MKRKLSEVEEEAGPSTKKAPRQFAVNPNKPIFLTCNPPEMVFEAAKFAKTVNGIERVTVTDESTGSLVAIVSEGGKFRKSKNCFSTKNWSVVQNPLVKEFRLQLSESYDDVITHLKITQMDLTGLEKAALPLLNWIYSLSGKISSMEQYILLTQDLLFTLNLSTDEARKNSNQNLTRMASLDSKFILLKATTIFNLNYIPEKENSTIINPLQYWPAGGLAVAVPINLVCKAFSNCITPTARGLGDLFAKCIGRLIETHAQATAIEMGPEKFEEEVAKPAIEQVKEAMPIMTASEAEAASQAKLVEMEIELEKNQN